MSIMNAGPQGPVGPVGPRGRQGAQGAQGSQGDTGARGPKGPQGPAAFDEGPQGPQGAAGAAGAVGPQGAPGTNGAAGAQGAAGTQGPQGATGAAGSAGAQGAAGTQGPQGPAGTSAVLTRVITVDKGGAGSYTTIKEALDYVATQSPGQTSQWVVQVGPGEYQELQPLTVPAFTTLRSLSGDGGSNGALTTVIKVTAGTLNPTTGAIMSAGNGSKIEGFYIIGGAMLGSVTGDIWLVRGTGAIELRGCYLTMSGAQTQGRNALLYQSSSIAQVWDCEFNAGGTGNETNAILTTGSASVTLHGGHVYGAATASGLRNESSGTSVLNAVRFGTASVALANDVVQTAGTVRTHNCEIGNVSGSVTVIGYYRPASSSNASAPNGTVYVATDDNKLTFKDSGGVTTTIAPGPQGPQGAAGAQGAAGSQGAAGTQGPQGPAGSGGSDELEYWRVRAALIEPAITRSIYGFESYTIPSNETHYHSFSWNLHRDDAAGKVRRFENRSVLGGLVPLRNVTLRGYSTSCLTGSTGSFGWFHNPTGITYADPISEYYRKLNIIHSQPTRDSRNNGVGNPGVSLPAGEMILPGEHGIAILQTGNFDKEWAGFMAELGDGFQPSQQNAADQRVHQEFRWQEVLREPAVADDIFQVLGSGHGFDWGTGTGAAATPQTAPVNWISFVNLPLSYWGANVKDRYAPQGYVLGISSTGTELALAPTVQKTEGTGGGTVTVHSPTEHMQLKAGTNDYETGFYDNRDFDAVAGRAFLVRFYYAANCKLHLGVGTGTGIASADYRHAVEIVNGTVTVHHDDGNGRVSRQFTGFTLAAGNSFLLKITFGSNGGAFYELQGTQEPTASWTAHPIGSNDWWDLLDGTTAAAAGTNATSLHIKGSIGGTAGVTALLAWPRIAEAHAGATSSPGPIWQSSFLGPVPVKNLNDTTAYNAMALNNVRPDRQGLVAMTTTNAWSIIEKNMTTPYINALTITPLGAWSNAGSIGQGFLKVNTGVADQLFEFTYACSHYAVGGLPEWYFNMSADGTQWWRVRGRLSNGTFWCENSNSVQLGPTWQLGAFPDPTYPSLVHVIVRIQCKDDNIKVWMSSAADQDTPTLVFDQTSASRVFKTNTYIALHSPDASDFVFLGGHQRYRGLTFYRA